MKNDLTSEQFTHYQAEVDKRNAARKQAAIHYFVSTIDQDLYLTDPQRLKLTESLSAHWDESWNTILEYQLYGQQFHPMGVDALVIPYLNAAQAKVWHSTQKVGALGGLFGVWGGFLNDNDALEEELGVAKRAKPADAIGALRNNMMNNVMKVQLRATLVEEKKAVIKDAVPKK